MTPAYTDADYGVQFPFVVSDIACSMLTSHCQIDLNYCTRAENFVMPIIPRL